MKDVLEIAEQAADNLDDALREAHEIANIQENEKGEMLRDCLSDLYADVTKIRNRLGILRAIAGGV